MSSIFRVVKNNQIRIWALLMILLTLAVYRQIVHHDFIVYLDDQAYITDNPAVRSGLTGAGFLWAFTTFHASNWHPLTWLSHMLDVQIFGLNPAGHHLVSLFVHIANALLLFLFLREASGSKYRSLLVATLFAVHPLHIESVAWVAERKDVLSTFFAMASLLAYVRYARRHSRPWYVASFAALLLGLLSKPMLVTIPFVMLLLDYWPLHRLRTRSGIETVQDGGTPVSEGISWRSALREKLPFFLLAAIASAVTVAAQQEWRSIQPLSLFSLDVRVMNAFVAYMTYCYRSLWPDALSVFYPHPGAQIEAWSVVLCASLVAGISALAVRFLKRFPYLFVGWFLFAGMLVPVIGIVQVGTQALADRYTYMPLIGIFIILAWGGRELCLKLHVSGTAAMLLAGTLIAYFSFFTWYQLHFWKNSATLFQRAIEVTERNYLAHFILCGVEAEAGNIGLSDYHYREAVRINKSHVAFQHNKAGYRLIQAGRADEAVRQFETALNLVPEYSTARYNLAVILAARKEYAAALQHLRGLLKREPHDERASSLLKHIERIVETRS